jgi:hypothetical protein
MALNVFLDIALVKFMEWKNLITIFVIRALY